MQLRQILTLLAAAITIAACTTESNFPEATGKGTVRAINAIEGSPPVVFLIEERTLGSVDYKGSTTPQSYDDLSYRFNFEVLYPEEGQRRRVASRDVQVVANRDTTFVLTGDIARPTVTQIDSDIRDWGDSDTSFEARFMHLAPSLGAIDIYLAADGVPPAAGEEVASLSNGETQPFAEFATGEYFVTITTAGDPADILYESTIGIFGGQTSWTISVFDGDENDLHPIVVRGFPASGATLPFAERNTRPQVRFVQASIDLPLADIYEDEMLTVLLHEDQAFGDVTAYEELDAGTKRISYTPANDTGSTLFASDFVAAGGVRADFFAVGQSGSHAGLALLPDRRALSTEARLMFIQASVNQEFVDVYVVPEGVSIDDEFPDRLALGFSTSSPLLGFRAGNYDIYVTPFGEKTILDGPFPVSIALGDVVEVMILDRVDPAMVELRILPPN